jgi:predicted RNA-binding Zn-ribbon protein involved in translation (DUF1610 family)
VPQHRRLEKRSTDPMSFVCPHCMREVSLPTDEPDLLPHDAEFRPKLAGFSCPLCTELIRLDN